jgi:branched-chain amino acid transport system substrate-binding protein
MLRSRLSVRSLGAAALCTAALAACGSNNPTALPLPKGVKPPTHKQNVVFIYSSLPMHGPRAAESRQIVQGINLELDDLQTPHRVGAYTIRYVSRDDSSARVGGWSQGATVTNAETAVRNPNTIAYIGDLDSGATELSLPILNQAGIVQITPGSAYPGLTNEIHGVTTPGEPNKYYPQPDQRTLLRLVPSDTVEAAAALDLLAGTKCQRVAAASFGARVNLDGTALLNAVELTAKLYGLTYVPTEPPGSRPSTAAGTPSATPAPTTTTATATTVESYASDLGRQGVGCFVLTGHVTPAAVALTRAIHLDLPGATIVGTSGFCNAHWTDQARHGVPADVDNSLYCTRPVRPPQYYQGGAAFIAEFRHKYGHAPGLYSIYGYQAAAMVVDAMQGFESDQDHRKQVRLALIDGGPLISDVIGTYGFDAAGNLLSTAYGIYHVVGGVPTYLRTLKPLHVLPAR